MSRCPCENSHCAHEPSRCPRDADPDLRVDHLGALCGACYTSMPREYHARKAAEREPDGDDSQRRGRLVGSPLVWIDDARRQLDNARALVVDEKPDAAAGLCVLVVAIMREVVGALVPPQGELMSDDAIRRELLKLKRKREGGS